MANLFGLHLPFTGYGPQYRVGDTIPGTATGLQRLQSMPSLRAFGGQGASPLGSILAARLGLGGLPSTADAYQNAAPTTTATGGTNTPATAPEGGIWGWFQSHGDALKGIGGVLNSGANVYGTVAQLQEEKRQRRFAEQEAERRRRDQEASAAAVAPGYAALLQALAGRLGAGTGG